MTKNLITIIGTIPDETRKAIESLKQYKSQRVAKIFTEEIFSRFNSTVMKLKTPYFGNNDYCLQYIQNNNIEKLLLAISRTGSVAGYFHLEKTKEGELVPINTVMVSSCPTIMLDAENRMVSTEETETRETPILLNIDDKEYPLIRVDD